MSNMFKFITCDKCGGDIYSDAGPYGVQVSCFQCGRSQFLMPDNMEAIVSAASGEGHSSSEKAA